MYQGRFAVILKIENDVAVSAYRAPWSDIEIDDGVKHDRESRLLRDFEQPYKDAVLARLKDETQPLSKNRYWVYWKENGREQCIRPRTLSNVKAPLPILECQSIESMLEHVKNIS